MVVLFTKNNFSDLFSNIKNKEEKNVENIFLYNIFIFKLKFPGNLLKLSKNAYL